MEAKEVLGKVLVWHFPNAKSFYKTKKKQHYIVEIRKEYHVVNFCQYSSMCSNLVAISPDITTRNDAIF
jgi:hypothetical protein